MQFLIYAISYPFIWLLSRLPMKILYLFSNFYYLLIYYVFGYRKKIVLKNLELAFPQKSKKERETISKKFFKHFTDMFMESVKAFSISKKEVLKRYKYTNPELVNRFAKEGKSIALIGAHQANWEWTTGLPLFIDAPIFCAYTKLTNRYFEKEVRKSRTKFGGFVYRSSQAVRQIQKNYTHKQQGVYILLSDQSPQLRKSHYWTRFFGIKVPVHIGAEILAKKFDLVVINYVAKKIKRGYYEVTFELITDTPKEYDNYQIIDKYIAITEKNIKKQPEFYLWSHKRFKHKDKVPAKFQ